MKNRKIWIIAIVALSIALIGYWARHREAPKSEPKKQPSVVVSTTAARQENYPVVLETNGTVSALNQVEVHPQISGLISKVHIQEGQFVKAGQLLFTLDAKAAEVEVTRARAQLQRDQATLADYERQLTRARELLEQNFISRSAVDTNRTQVEAQRAVVSANRAAVEAARVELAYTRIFATNSGRAGAINVHPGSYVQPGGAPLVVITQIDPIAVSFTLPQNHLQSVIERMRTETATVSVQLPEREQALNGRIHFVDNGIDPQTGTVQAKARFENPDNRLWPGAFVSVRAEVGHIENAIVIPAAAVVKSARGDQVFIAKDGKAEARRVQVLHSAREKAVVKGVDAGEAVIVNGKQNVKPGSPVRVEGARGKPAAAQAGRS